MTQPKGGRLGAQAEVADTLEEWKAVYAECFPHRNPEAMRVDDADLALAVMMRRELRKRVKGNDLSASRYDPE